MSGAAGAKAEYLPEQPYAFDHNVLDIMLPKHLISDRAGIIRKVGPTLSKLFSPVDVVGARLFDVLSFARPEGISDWESLCLYAGQSGRVELQIGTKFKANTVFAPLAGRELMLFDFSLGASVLDIISNHSLTTQDFSPADQTAEMMFMKEAHMLLLESSRDLNTRLHGAKSVAEQEAEADPLTGLKNRRALERAMARSLSRSLPQKLAVLLIDLDRFKQVNDTYGHAAGDYTLNEVGRILTSEVRSSDLVARLGGDEFVVLLNGVKDCENVSEIAQRIVERVARPIRFKDAGFSIGASIGVCLTDTPSQVTVDSMLHRADIALYQAKSLGKGQCVFYQTPA